MPCTQSDILTSLNKSKLSGLVNVLTMVLRLVRWWWWCCCLFLPLAIVVPPVVVPPVAAVVPPVTVVVPPVALLPCCPLPSSCRPSSCRPWPSSCRPRHTALSGCYEAPTDFSSLVAQNSTSNKNIAIAGLLDVDINAS